MFHTKLYPGKHGMRSENPFINIFTKICFPNSIPFAGFINADSTDLAHTTLE